MGVRKVPVFCAQCGSRMGEEEVPRSFRGNAFFSLCQKCRKTGKAFK